MKPNNKKISIAKSKSVISQKKKENLDIPKDSPEILNKFLNQVSKAYKKEKKISINEDVKNIVEHFINDEKNNFDKDYKHYYVNTKNDYNIIKLNKELIEMVCAENIVKLKKNYIF
jgi:hypothetical protein